MAIHHRHKLVEQIVAILRAGGGFGVVLNAEDRPMSQAELRDAFSNADAVFPTVSDRIDTEVLSAEPLRAKLLGSFGVGFNHIDLEAAKARGIAVTNTTNGITITFVP